MNKGPAQGPVLANAAEPAAARRPVPPWHLMAVLWALYFAVALLSLAIARQPGSIATVWFANALGLAALLFSPRSWWPRMLLVLGSAVAAANLVHGDRWHIALAFVPANLLEMGFGAWALRRIGMQRLDVRTPQALLRLLVRGALLPQLLAAGMGAATLSALGLASLATAYVQWFAGSVIGAVSVLPLAYLVCRNPIEHTLAQLRNWRMAVLLPLTAAVTLLSLIHLPYPFIYLALPLLLAAMQVELAAVALLTAMVSVLVAASLAFGAFLPPPLTAQWMQVYVYMAYAAALLPAQLLAAAMADLRDSHHSLAERTHELKRANEGLQNFVRMVSHDLREPLNTITQFSSLVREDHAEKLPADGQRYLGLVSNAAQRMRSLLDAVLQYARLPNPGQAVLEQVDLNELLREVVESLAGRLHEAGGRVELATLPLVRGHRALLTLLFQNLVANGLKFAQDGRAPVVWVRATVSAGQAQVEVVDNGMGIAEEDLPKLFKPFSRLHLRRQFEGHGLGLALSLQVAQAHGGHLEVLRTSPGVGTALVVSLPLALPQQATAQ